MSVLKEHAGNASRQLSHLILSHYWKDSHSNYCIFKLSSLVSCASHITLNWMYVMDVSQTTFLRSDSLFDICDVVF